MAGDWIKMRVSLVNHPKVLALSEEISHYGDYQEWSGLSGFIPSMGGSQKDFDDEVIQALRVTRYVTVTALLRFWGYANEHAKDEFISSLRISDIDEIAGIPSFGIALEAIGWAVYDEERRGVMLPNFAEHNSTANDRGAADRQKRYRENKKLRDVTSDVTPLHREEKRREEKIKDTKPTSTKSAISISTFLQNCDDAGEKRIPETDAVFDFAEKTGIPLEMIKVCWKHFVETNKQTGKRQKDWRGAFRNCVKGNWYKLWFVEADGTVKETSQYRALKKGLENVQ